MTSLQYDSSGSAVCPVTGTLGKGNAVACGINVGRNSGDGAAASTQGF